MGAVFLCEDLRLPGQVWAIKEMLSAHPLETPLVEDSFRREAQLLAGLRHESLPVIVDSFVEGARHYLVMEYIPGETVAGYVERVGPLPARQALQWALELADVLSYLHSQQPPIIFRDLKPENVMVADSQRLKLVDFGLARHFRPGQARDTQAAGSIGYSAPEQWEDSDQTDERSDIYGLGAVLHFLLSGKPPSPTYGQQNLRQYRTDLDPALESVILKCLAADPASRYADCGQLILALQPKSAVASPRRRKKLAPWLALAGLVLAVGLGFAFTLTPVVPEETLGMEQILQRTAQTKAALRQRLIAGQVAQALGPLEKLTREFPEDGEAQILLNNARVLQSPRSHLTIPVFSSTSGSEYEGVQMLNGLALAQKELNQGGVVDARRPQLGPQGIVLDYVNCDSRQELTLEAYLKAASQKQYALAIGPWSSQQLRIVSPIVESAGFPTVAPTASDPGTSDLGPNSLTVADTDVGRVKALARFFSDQGLKRAVVMRNEDSVVGHSSAAHFRREFASLGGATVAELGYLQDTHDYSALLDQVASLDADCVFLPEYRAAVVMTLTRQLRARGLRLRVGSLAAIYSHSPLETSQGLNGLVVCSYFFSQAPSVRGFTARYQSFSGSATPSHREANAYDSLFLVAQAIREAGFERAALRDYLNSLGKSRPAFRGVSGEFSPRRHQETRHPYILEMHNGQLRML